MIEQPEPRSDTAIRAPENPEIPFGSNDVRLNGRQWLLVAVIFFAICWLLPLLWENVEPFEPESDYRIPYELSNDYGLYERYCRKARALSDVLVIGDSVIWGDYVRPDETLSAHLNRRARSKRYANLGVNGIHPAALEGLLRHHARPLRDCRVLIHSNLLWMSSARHDLSQEEAFRFNHPELVPQFYPRVPCYSASASERLDRLIARYVSLRSWVKHVRLAYLDSDDLHRWSLDHPRSNPLARITLKLPQPARAPRHDALSWTARSIRKQDLPWVDIDSSLQWRSFRRSIDILTRRGNEVFVVVGPFNEHMLAAESLQRYRRLKRGIERWFRERGIAFLAASLLPSDLYADASHPLSRGYELLAAEILRHGPFRRWLGE